MTWGMLSNAKKATQLASVESEGSGPGEDVLGNVRQALGSDYNSGLPFSYGKSFLRQQQDNMIIFASYKISWTFCDPVFSSV